MVLLSPAEARLLARSARAAESAKTSCDAERDTVVIALVDKAIRRAAAEGKDSVIVRLTHPASCDTARTHVTKAGYSFREFEPSPYYDYVISWEV